MSRLATLVVGLGLCLCLGLLSSFKVFKVFAFFNSQRGEHAMLNRYIITETAPYSSLDPLDGDSTPNLPVQDLIYARPIEVNHDERFYSRVLDSFSYDPEKKLMRLSAKEGLRFSDGSPLTADDIAFAILRMAYKRPAFPVVRSIVGLQAWLERPLPLAELPEGVRIEGSTIRIQFTKNVQKPLARLSLQLFSIIPKRCVDLKSNALLCDPLPRSGLYDIKSQDPTRIVFALRAHQDVPASLAKEIRFEYMSAEEALATPRKAEERLVIATNETLIWPQNLAALYQAQWQITLQPKSRFDVLYLVPRSPAFQDKAARQFFIAKFRAQLLKIGLSETQLEASIFTSIMPGYLSLKELALRAPAAPLRENPFRGQTVAWASRLPASSPSIQALRATIKELGLQEKEAEGEFDLMLGSTGFWPIDPMGDLQMLFTPGLHGTLAAAADNPELQRRIALLQDASGEELQDAARSFTEFLYDEAVFNIYKYNQRMFLSSFEPSVSLVTNTTSPWQFFVHDE